MSQVYKQIAQLVSDRNALISPFQGVHPHFKEVMELCVLLDYTNSAKSVLKDALIKVTRTLTFLHDHLNVGKWTEVPEFYRKAFTAVSFVKAELLLAIEDESEESLRSALKIIDEGFLLGLPLDDQPRLLTQSAVVLNNKLFDKVPAEKCTNVSTKRIKLSSTSNQGIEVPIVDCLSLQSFASEYFFPMKPVVIKDHMHHWPATKKWHDMNYLLQHAGERTVPIEIGSSYSAENFSQKLMTVKEFVRLYLNPTHPPEIGYLAQHDLLTQIPQLGDDVRTPEYCCISRQTDREASEPQINAWFGPKGTVSSLHFDPNDNILCQVFGAKQIILFPPDDAQYLYTHNGILSNTSKVDPTRPDLNTFPLFTKCTMYRCYLESGQMLYIPPKWWHHVTSLAKSFSVNFWWS